MSPPGSAWPVLETETLVAGYEPDLPIVNGVDLAVAAGEILAILGPNGAGKSTFVKAIAGFVPVFAGGVRLAGEDITRIPSHRLVARGLAFVPQSENIFARLSIHENLQLASAVLPASRRADRIEAAFGLFPDLAERPSRPAGSLSGGQRQMLATARALLIEPRVLILDEPSAGLSPKLVGEVLRSLISIRTLGVTIVLVEQNVRSALRIADRALILAGGRARFLGAAAPLADDPNLHDLFLAADPGLVPDSTAAGDGARSGPAASPA